MNDNKKIKNSLNELITFVNETDNNLIDLINSIEMSEKSSLNSSNDIVEINVGGKLFTCCLSTITRKIRKFKTSTNDYYSPHLLELIINGEVSTKRDQDNRIFIERSPTYFDYILKYLITADTEENLN